MSKDVRVRVSPKAPNDKGSQPSKAEKDKGRERRPLSCHGSKLERDVRERALAAGIEGRARLRSAPRPRSNLPDARGQSPDECGILLMLAILGIRASLRSGRPRVRSKGAMVELRASIVAEQKNTRPPRFRVSGRLRNLVPPLRSQTERFAVETGPWPEGGWQPTHGGIIIKSPQDGQAGRQSRRGLAAGVGEPQRWSSIESRALRSDAECSTKSARIAG